MARISGFGDLKKGAGGSRSDDEDESRPGAGGKSGGNSYYAGGKSSGLAVMAPKKGGAGGGGPSAADGIFAAADKDPGMKAEGVSKGSVTLSLWKNGYTIDDGELNSYDTPEGKAFMASVEAGRIPPSIEAHVRASGKMPRGGAVDVSVEDKRAETYTPPPYRAFGGAGAAAGGGVTVAAAAVVRGPAGGPALLDESRPTTTLQVRLANGKRERIVMNLHHTVADLQARVAALGGVPAGKGFALTAGFPPKPLAGASETIEAAGLANASVTQVAV